jgi:hypothetical protein
VSTSQATTTEIDRYLAAVQARLVGVPEAEEMIDDLRQHLAEVAAEGEGPLEERLGAPASYADELRASAGLGSPPGKLTTLLGRLPGAAWSSRARTVAERWREDPRAASALDFARQLRPAWWAVRGYLLVLGWSIGNESSALYVFPWPRIEGRRSVGLLVTLLVVAASVWVGRRERQSKRARLAGIALSALALFMTGMISSQVRAVARQPAFELHEEASWPWGSGGLTHPDGRPITNIYPFGPDGEPLEGVLLYDQDGQPLQLVVEYGPDGERIVTSYPLDEDGRPVTNAFPQHQAPRDDAPWAGAGGRPSPDVPRLREAAGADAPEDAEAIEDREAIERDVPEQSHNANEEASADTGEAGGGAAGG